MLISIDGIIAQLETNPDFLTIFNIFSKVFTPLADKHNKNFLLFGGKVSCGK